MSLCFFFSPLLDGYFFFRKRKTDWCFKNGHLVRAYDVTALMSIIAAYMEIFLKKHTNERTKQFKKSVKNAVLCGAVNELDEKHKLHG
jgi:hypothetical protein